MAGSRTVPAAFVRGGSSKALVFREECLPTTREEREILFLRAMGSPDPNGRQLDGMGGGVSSLSKVCIVGPSTHPDADVDYTFAQVQIDRPRVDWSGNCGNMSSAIGPFAVDEGMLGNVRDGETSVVIHNTNTSRLIRATFEVRGGRAVHRGDLVIPGVGGSGAPIRLDFLDPGGATTGTMLPAGTTTTLTIAGHGKVGVSLIDVANACVYVHADDVGLSGTELPDRLGELGDAMRLLEDIRVAGSLAFGIEGAEAAARANRLLPFVAVVSPAADFETLAGETVRSAEIDLNVRVMSNGQPHRAIPITIGVCTAVAAALPGSIPNRVRLPGSGDRLRIGMPSGVIHVGGDVSVNDGPDGRTMTARSGFVYRTSRRLFSGSVHV